MSSSDLPMGEQSSRRELHGPRPTPLKVRKDSYKIRKPPVAAPQQAAPPPQQRRPIIIYTVSPKVIHTTPGDFMSVVQRLTGPAAIASSSSAYVPGDASMLSPRIDAAGKLFSPAARLATFEKTAQTAHASSGERLTMGEQNMAEVLLGIDGAGASTFDRSAGPFPGILSPIPSSLPFISPDLFASSTAQQHQINFFNELSPAIHSNRSFLGINSFFPSPSNFLSSGIVPSPAAYWDLFNQNQD
ncbi:unnamed protein product [Musa textilis]